MNDPFLDLKAAFSRYPTGVTVVSCLPAKGGPVAITVNSFTSVSLDPSLVLWCIERRASVFEAFAESEAYAVSVLAADQQSISNQFATPGRHSFPAETGEVAITGCPLVRGRVAGFDTKIVTRHEAGDHVILIGEVVHFDSREGAPLVYAGRHYFSGPVIS